MRSGRSRVARVAVSAVFFVHGAVFASWAARVSEVRDGLQLSAGRLGLVMAAPGLGALVGSQVGGVLVSRLGSRTVSALAPVALCVPLALIPTAGSAWALLGVLLLLGVGDGSTAVAMSAQGTAVQNRYGRPILNAMHATRSLGAVAGGLGGSATASLGLSTQFVATATVLAVVSTAAAVGLLPDEAIRQVVDRSPHLASRDLRPAVVLLAAMTFLAALVSDAPASWGGVYLRHLGAGPAMAASAYAAFSAGELVSRLVNDRLAGWLGWARLIRIGTLSCAAALALALPVGDPTITLGALIIAGAGISAVFPGAFTAAGALPAPAIAMAQVNFAGNLGWLLVSPIIGGLATVAGLPKALALLPAAAASIAALAAVTQAVRYSDISRRSAEPHR